MPYTLQGLIAFLKASSSAFHAVENVGRVLEKEGFVRLQESRKWMVQPGGKYFVTRNQSSLIAFTLPKGGFAPMNIVASHSDSPVFRIKQRAELESAGKYIQINTERYGGMILSSWLDRPLSIAGRVFVRSNKGVQARLVKVDRDLLLIPNLAIHMNRDMNDGVKLNPQVDMLPLYGDLRAKGSFDALIAAEVGVKPEQIVGGDLYLYNRMEPSVWGGEGDYISAPRLDDLECAYTSLCAFTAAQSGKHINMYCLFDNEEVGSGTRQGADSSFLQDVLTRTACALNVGSETLCACLASSFMVSADNAHALHPNHPEKSDAANRPCMNEGVVIKFSANQKYTTDGMSSAVFSDICRRAEVPIQYYANRSDMLGGSTLGNISSSHVSIPAVDIGLAQLAMHSSFETAGTKDAQYMTDALKAFYEAEICAEADGVYSLK